MAEPSTKENRELSLGDDFGPAVVRVNGLTVSTDGNGQVKLETGGVTVDITNGNTTIYGGNVTAHTDGTVQLKAPTAEQTNAPGAVSSNPTAGAFNPANAVVSAGQVQLNKVSKYLSDLPDTAKAELLVAPKDTAKIFDRDIGTFNEDTASIRSINESHGIHHAGQALKGMDIADRPSSAKDVTYEEAWAKKVRSAWEQANQTGEAVTTGLAIGTKQMVHGREIGTRDVTVANNLYSNVGGINAALKAQGAQEIITSFDSGTARWQFAATEDPVYRSYVSSVVFTDGDYFWALKGGDHSSSRPVALQIAPAP